MLFLITFSQIITLLGSEFTKFAIPIWLYERNGSALSVTIAILISLLPNLLLGPLVGGFVDQVSKKRVLILCELGQALALSALFWSVERGGASPLLIYSALGVQSIFSLFQYPAMASISPQLFSGRKLERFNSLLSMADSGSIMLGPVLAGFTLQFIALGRFLMIDAISFVLSALVLTFLPHERAESPAPSNLREMWLTTFMTLRELTRTPALFQFLLVGACVNFAISLSYGLINPYLKLIFAGDLGRVGMANGFAGAMQLAGAASIMVLPEIRRRARFQLWCIFALGVAGALTIGLTSKPLISTTGYAFTLFFLTLMNTVNRTAWQKAVPREDIGKIFALKRMVSSSIAPLGFLFSGLIFDYGFKATLHLEPATSFRGLFLLSGSLLVAVFAFNIQRDWIRRFDGIV